MTKITATLTAWQNAMRDAERQMDELYKLFDYAPEAPLPDAIGRLMGAYTRQVADCIGWDRDALESWWLDSDFGARRPMEIGFKDEPLRSISTIEELADYLARAGGKA